MRVKRFGKEYSKLDEFVLEFNLIFDIEFPNALETLKISISILIDNEIIYKEKNTHKNTLQYEVLNDQYKLIENFFKDI